MVGQIPRSLYAGSSILQSWVALEPLTEDRRGDWWSLVCLPLKDLTEMLRRGSGRPCASGRHR